MADLPYVPPDDAEQPLLPLLLAELGKRDLTPDDFPDELLLPWPEQRQLIEKALERGRIHCAHPMAVPLGFPMRPPGGRVEWALRRWLKIMVATMSKVDMDEEVARARQALAVKAAREGGGAMTDPLDGIRGLTLIQPMAWAIFHGLGGESLGRGLKDVENRTWPPPIDRLGKPLAIHGGKTWDKGYEQMVREVLHLDALPAEAHATGILGVVTLDRVITGDFYPMVMRVGAPLRRTAVGADSAFTSEWYCGPYGWVLRDPVVFREPVACRGNRGLWPLPPEVLERVRDAEATRRV